MSYVAIAVPSAPLPSSDSVSRVFRANRRRDTRPEIALRRALFAKGLRFLVDITPNGLSRRRRVDVLLRGSRIAVLVHGCFWHCCPDHFVMPKSNREWWEIKFSAILNRDRDTVFELVHHGWAPVIVWEHEDENLAVSRILRLDRERRRRTPRGVSTGRE